MQLNIPPIVSYVFGGILVVFGALRVKYLAAPRPQREDDDPESSTQGPAVRGKVQQRHLRWGIIYVLLGLFLILSTYWQLHRR